MNNELANLPQDLREAVEQFDCVTMHGEKWKIIRAALLLNVNRRRQTTALKLHEYRNDDRVFVKCQVPPSWNNRRVAVILLPEDNT